MKRVRQTKKYLTASESTARISFDLPTTKAGLVTSFAGTFSPPLAFTAYLNKRYLVGHLIQCSAIPCYWFDRRFFRFLVFWVKKNEKQNLSTFFDTSEENSANVCREHVKFLRSTQK